MHRLQDAEHNAHEQTHQDTCADDAQEEVIGCKRKLRSLVFHILYAMESSDYEPSLGAVVDGLNRGFDQEIEDGGEITVIAQEIVSRRQELDDTIFPLLENWRFDRLGCCTRLILRYALWELLFTQTPSTIVINEAIELSKCFSEKDAYRFVNGVLDEALKQLPSLRQREDNASAS